MWTQAVAASATKVRRDIAAQYAGFRPGPRVALVKRCGIALAFARGCPMKARFAVVVLLCGCAPAGPSADELRSVQIAIVNGLLSATSDAPHGKTDLTRSGGCVPSGNTAVCNIQVSTTDSAGCAGGYISASGSLTGTISAGGITYLNLHFTMSPVSCGVGGWQVSGDPYLSMNGTIQGTGAVLTISGVGPAGGWSMSQNGEKHTCLIQHPSSWH